MSTDKTVIEHLLDGTVDAAGTTSEELDAMFLQLDDLFFVADGGMSLEEEDIAPLIERVRNARGHIKLVCDNLTEITKLLGKAVLQDSGEHKAAPKSA
jgi:hypothetical protein